MKFSFLGMGQEAPPLQFYGKLPVAKDYLRIGCGDGAGRELREWLDRTFGTVRDASEALVLEEPLRFLGQGAKETLQGYLWPSSDAGEHRSFPFTVFVERRKKAVLADLDGGNLSEAEAVWRLLAETRERCLEAPDGQTLLEAQRGRELEVAASDPVAGAAADFDTWVASLFGTAQIDGLRELFDRVRRLGESRHSGPLRLPLARVLPLRDQVIAWVRLLRELRLLADGEVPTIFFPPRALVPSSLPANLVISRGPIKDEEVRWLTASADEDLGPSDLASLVDGEHALDVSPPESDEWLADSLLAALGATAGGGS